MVLKRANRLCDFITESIKKYGIIKTQRKKEDNKMSVLNINKSNFEAEVLQSEQKVLLDFWAPWCAPCRMLAPIVDEIATERPDLKVVKVNVDEEVELAAEYGIMSIPTLVVFEKGEVINKITGARPKEAILEMV
jgi:thioredoxin 1